MDTDHQTRKVYVAVGNDVEDGYKTLDWTLGKWKDQSVSIVILHVTSSISIKDFVNTPIGKLRATSVSDDKLELLRKYEQIKTDDLLSMYIAYCGKVKTEIQKVEKNDEPIHKLILDLVSGQKITKLVLGLSFMKPSPGKSRSAISGSFYVHQYKPDYCDLFIICGGRLVYLKEESSEGIMMEDDGGVTVARMRERVTFGNLLTRMFSGNVRNSSHLPISSKVPDSAGSQNPENYMEEIENYFQYLVSLNLDKSNSGEAKGDIVLHKREEQTNPNLSVAEKLESVKCKINEALEMIQLQKKEIKDNAERSAKAEWAICLCNTRADQLKSLIEEAMRSRMEMQENLGREKERVCEVTKDVAERKGRLSSVAGLLSELSIKMQVSATARGHAQARLEKAVIARAEMVRDIEELRRQRDVLHRRIEFCKEKDAIRMATRSTELSCGCREYSAEDMRLATEGFSERFRLKYEDNWTNVYRGRLNYANIAIKMFDTSLTQEDFQTKVNFLADIRHGHLVATMGFCSEPKCIILEYMHNGNLRDTLYQTSYKRCSHAHAHAIRWHDRIRIAHEVSVGLGFLHAAEPRPIVHGNLAPSTIFLDRNLVAKISISGLGLSKSAQNDVRLDIKALGVLLWHLLTAGNWGELGEESAELDRTALVQALDENAGKWPLDLAEELVRIAKKCSSVNQEANRDLRIASVIRELDEVRKRADSLVDKRVISSHGCPNKEDSQSLDVPSIFMCPIFQEVMRNPHVAADGFSYELEAMEEWLGMGHDTSPMTNLRLRHKHLTPNHTLRSLIQEWLNKQPNNV